MKSALAVVLFRLFTIGVFIDGKETSNGELVSVTEGDSVTLKSGVTDIQTDDGIEWRFNGKIKIATISKHSSKISLWVKPDGSFRDRLQLDSQTGDLKISNIRTTDSGQYKPTFSSPGGSPPEMTFTVKVVSADAVKPVSVLEGDSVTLHTDPTYIQRYDVIRWRFDHQNSPIAEIDRTAGIFNTSDGPDGRFRDRLQLDNQTGSLIITNTTTTHSGLYEVEISSTSSRYTIHHTQSFSVTVSAVPYSGLPRAAGVWIGVAVGVILVAALVIAAVVMYYFWCNSSELERQPVPYSGLPRAAGVWIGVAVCVILVAALVIAAVVMYYFWRNSSELERQPVPYSGLSPAAVAGIAVAVGVILVTAAVIVAVVMYYRRRNSSELERQNVNGQNRTSNGTPDPDDHANEGTELTNA